MKPSIPDTGTVIRLEGEKAVLRMNGHESCRKCGAAAIGLCKGGMMREVIATNGMRARVGDTVKIGLVWRIQYQGYLLAYVMPAAALVVGVVGGHYLGTYAGFAPLDIIGGFLSLALISFFSLKRLKRLDSSHSIEIVHVLSDPWVPGSPGSDEGTVRDYFALYY